MTADERLHAVWTSPVERIPDTKHQHITVVYSDGSAMVTCWADERAENRVDEIVYWMPVVQVVGKHGL